MSNECQNCQSPLDPDFQYCPDCGQKTGEQLTLGILFNNTIANYFSVDSRFFVSFIPLLFLPGYLPREFIKGKRKKYLHPAQFYLFITVAFFFLFSFHTRKQQEQFDDVLRQSFENGVVADSGNIYLEEPDAVKGTVTELNKQGIAAGLDTLNIQTLDSIADTDKDGSIFGLDIRRKKLDSLIAADASAEDKMRAMGMKEDAGKWTRRFYAQLLKFYERRGGGLLEAFYDSIPVAMFFLLPLYALFLKLLFFRRGLYAHHLVFSFYFFSFLFAVFSIILIANMLYPVPDWIDWILVLLTGIYLWLAIKKFYGQGYVISFIKTGIISGIYLLFVLPTALIVLVVISFMIY